MSRYCPGLAFLQADPVFPRPGLLGPDLPGSNPEALVLDTDVYHHIRRDLAGLDTSQAALALEVIKAVGPRGHFLRQRHTREHLRQRWFSDLTAQLAEGGGYRDPLEVAREKTDWILENHRPVPLDRAQQAELGRILQVAERDLGGE